MSEIIDLGLAAEQLCDRAVTAEMLARAVRDVVERGCEDCSGAQVGDTEITASAALGALIEVCSAMRREAESLRDFEALRIKAPRLVAGKGGR